MTDPVKDAIEEKMVKIRELNPHNYENLQSYRMLRAKLARLNESEGLS